MTLLKAGLIIGSVLGAAVFIGAVEAVRLKPVPDTIAVSTDSPTPSDTSTPSPRPRASQSASPEATTSPDSAVSASPTSSATASTTSQPTSTPTATSKVVVKSTPTPSPNTSGIQLSVDRAASTCGSQSLRFVPAGEGAKYQDGLTYTTITLGNASTITIPDTNTAAIVYVINAAGSACLAGYQLPGTNLSLGLASTTDAVAYPDFSGTSAYQAGEISRRLEALPSYAPLSTFMRSHLTSTLLTDLSTDSTFLDLVAATTAAYDAKYPGGF
jgi:hypothetical protein